MADGVRRRGLIGRVRVTYALPGGRGNAELPFVVGVMGDYAGRSKAMSKLRDRKFIDVSEQNFDAVLAAMSPRLECTVENRLTGGESGLRVDLTFRALKDFEPEQVARQVEPLRRLVELRERLQALRAAVHRRREAGPLAAPTSPTASTAAGAAGDAGAPAAAPTEEPGGGRGVG